MKRRKLLTALDSVHDIDMATLAHDSTTPGEPQLLEGGAALMTAIPSTAHKRCPAAVSAVLLALFAGSFVLAACGGREASGPESRPPQSVTVTPVERATVADRTAYVGRTESVAVVDLRARVIGFLEQRIFEEGSDVEEGDLLYVIEQEPYQAALDTAAGVVAQAEAALQNAEQYLKRLDAVRDSGATSKADLEAAERSVLETRAILKQTQARLTRARLDLGYTEIRAPISGRIGRTAVHVGNLVGPESGVLATIVKLDPVWVSFPVSERDYLAFHEKARAEERRGQDRPRVVPTIRLADGSTYPHAGKLDFQDNRMDSATGTLMVRATFPNPDSLLLPGQFVTVVETENRKVERLLIPQAAVQRDQVGPFVLLVNQEKVAEMRRIKLGDEHGTKWIVSEGLEAGEWVISNGIQKVKPGSPVEPSTASSGNDKKGPAGAE